MVKDWKKRLEDLETERLALRKESSRNAPNTGRNQAVCRLNKKICIARQKLNEPPEDAAAKEKKQLTYKIAGQKRAEKLRGMWVEKSRKTQLVKDLRLLNTIIREIRNKLEFPEKNRKRSLAAYHKNEDRLDRPHDRRKGLESAMRRVVKWEEDAPARLSELVVAGQIVVKRAARNENKKIRSKILRSLRRRFQNAFRYGVNFSKTIRELSGCSLEELRRHLESLWQPGMTWENYGYAGWHIDHKRPCASFPDLSDPAQQKECFHFSNLQPLWAKDNLTKRDKIS